MALTTNTITEVFNSYEDFLAREDKTINGVSIEFSIKHPNYKDMNKTNIGCYNCNNCNNCNNCDNCYNCDYCYSCNYCNYCYNCDNCNNCNNCDYCNNCNYQ
jgi:hypothetical protein